MGQHSAQESSGTTATVDLVSSYEARHVDHDRQPSLRAIDSVPDTWLEGIDRDANDPDLWAR